MDVAVVGGGLFGTTVAIEAAALDVVDTVDVYERKDDILRCASANNQCRLHRGYHYPRSVDTALEALEAEPDFRAMYPGAVIDSRDHYYGIASDGSKTTPTEFRDHCDRLGLAYTETSVGPMNDDALDLCVEVNESQIDPVALRSTIRQRIRQRDTISLYLNHEVERVNDLSGYDYIVVATYTSNNCVLDSYPSLHRDYKFQVIERPVARLPDEFHRKSLIVLDGPFMNIEPYSDSGYFHLGHVVHGEHHSNVGQKPELGDIDPAVINAGIVENPPVSKYEESIAGGRQFYPRLDEAEYVGSKFTIRTVLPDVEDTDARPTLVEREDDVFSVFSGKLSTCVTAAATVTDELGV